MELKEMHKNDNPDVVERFNSLLDITSQPKHVNLERRISSN